MFNKKNRTFLIFQDCTMSVSYDFAILQECVLNNTLINVDTGKRIIRPPLQLSRTITLGTFSHIIVNPDGIFFSSIFLI